MTNTPDTSPEAVERFDIWVDELDLLRVELNNSQGAWVTWEFHEQSLRALSAERDALKAELAEAAGLLKVALKAVNWSFSAGVEEREGGSARRQGKLLDQIRPFETDARAFLNRHHKETDT